MTQCHFPRNIMTSCCLPDKFPEPLPTFLNTAKPQIQSYIQPQQLHQGKSTWHRSHVLVYISPILSYLLGSVSHVFLPSTSTWMFIIWLSCFFPPILKGEKNCQTPQGWGRKNSTPFRHIPPNTLSAALAVSPRSKPKRKRSIPNLGFKRIWASKLKGSSGIHVKKHICLYYSNI